MPKTDCVTSNLMRKTHSASRSVHVSVLLDILRDLTAHPYLLSSRLAVRAGVSRSTLHRLLAAAERDLGVVIGARHNPGGMWVEDWGLLDQNRVLSVRSWPSRRL